MASLLEPTNKRMKLRHRLTFVRDVANGKQSVLEIDQQDYHALEATLQAFCANTVSRVGYATIDAVNHEGFGGTHGVKLDPLGRVTSFSHEQMHFRGGRVPESLFDLDELRHLELCYDSSGTTDNELQFPDEIRNLVNLEGLTLTTSGTTRWPQGFGELKNLKMLHFSGTADSEMPSEIGGLEKLEVLIFQCCQMLQTLPSELGRLANLISLEIDSSECLESLPDCIGDLHSLEELKIHSCGRLTSLPDSIGKLQHLEVLEFTVGFLRESPTFIGKLSNLTDLKILDLESGDRHKWINCDVSFFGSLGHLTKLTKLQIAASHLLWIPPSLFTTCKEFREVTLGWDFHTSFTPTHFERICKLVPSVEQLTMISLDTPDQPHSSSPLKFSLNSQEILVPIELIANGLPVNEVSELSCYHFIDRLVDSSWVLAKRASLSLPKLRVLSLEAPCVGFCEEVLLSTLQLPRLEEFTYRLTPHCSVELLCKKLLTRCLSLKKFTIDTTDSEAILPPSAYEALSLLPIHYLGTHGTHCTNRYSDVEDSKVMCHLGCVMSMNRARSLLQQGQLYSALWPLILADPKKAFPIKYYHKCNRLVGITEDADAIFFLLRERAFEDL